MSAAASAVVAALERAWVAIRVRHTDVPAAVVILASGVEAGKLVKWGHWAEFRWSAGEERLSEVLIAGERLAGADGAADALETLLHEAAHALATARGIKDTSRSGRYHNARYKALAEEIGLAVEQSTTYGWSSTSLTPAVVDAYASTLEDLRSAIRMFRAAPRRAGAPAAAGARPTFAGASPCARSACPPRRRPRRRSCAGCAVSSSNWNPETQTGNLATERS